MRERIKKFMDFKGISASNFADILDVQRSNISHILNGRSKPGFDFVEKLKAAFPELDLNWLYSGTGPMIIEKGSDSQTIPDLKLPFDQEIKKTMENKNLSTVKTVSSNTISTDYQEFESQQTSSKKTEKIIIFHSDKTFSEYRPE